MATILIWMSPEAGHILPTIKFAHDLVDRGHKVIYQCCDAISSELQSIGFDTYPFLDSFSHLGVNRSLFTPSSSSPQFFRQLMSQCSSLDEFTACFHNEVLRAADAVEPDLILIDGIKSIGYELYKLLRKKYKVARVCVHLRPLTSSEQRGEDGPLLFLCPEEFEIPSARQKGAIYTEGAPFTGIDFEEFQDSFDKLSSPIVYISFGSQVDEYPALKNVLPEIMKASALDDWRFVINAGRYAAELHRVSPGNVLIFNRVPQYRFLETASAMISHGGLGSIKDCIYRGVPMLIIPQLWDQPANAERVVFHKLGISFANSHISANMVSIALKSLIKTASYRKQLASMREAFVKSEQRQLMANMCEYLLQSEY